MNLILMLLLTLTDVYTKMGASLREKIQGMKDNEKIPVIVVMKQGYDLSKFKEDDYDGKRKYMMKTAEESQKPVIDWLKSIGETENLKQFFVINGFALKISKKALLELLDREDVAYAIEDEYRRWIPEEPRNYTKASYPTGSSEVPWDRQIMQADKVWKELGYGGEGIVVGIMDTGVDVDHPALKDNWRGIAGWYDAVNGRATPYDDNMHGTACASILAGKYNLGIAPKAKWIAVKILNNQGRGSTSQILSGFNWIASLPDSLKPRIVSNSWGLSSWNDATFFTACSTWKALGIFPVFAIGNDGSDPTKQSVPGTYPTVLAVGATDPNDQILSYSSRGGAPNLARWNNTYNWYAPDWNRHKPDVCAPADPVLAAYPGGDYINDFNGTSSATPHAAGEAALILSKNPYLTLSQLYLTIRNNTKLIQPQRYDYPNDTTGWGRIDAYRAVLNTPEPTKSNIVILDYTIDDRLGNSDGRLQPGERIYLSVRFKNRGVSATSVTASLVFDSIPGYPHYVTYNTRSVSLGSMGRDEEKTGTFDITLSSSAPKDQYLYFTVKVVTSDATRYLFLNVPIAAVNYPPRADSIAYDNNTPYYNPSNDNYYGNYTYFAMRFEAPAPCRLDSLRVYFYGTATNETLFVWKHNATYNAPDAELYGYALINVNTARAWAKVTLSSPIYITQPGCFWIGIRKNDANSVPYQDNDGAKTVNLSTNNRLDPSSWWGRNHWYDFCMRAFVYIDTVTTPQFTEVTSWRLDDSYYGNNDGFIDPGERASLKISIKNIGITAEQVLGYLYTADQATADSVVIEKDTAYFGTVYKGEGTNDNDPFIITFTKWSGLSGFDPTFQLILHYYYGSGLRNEKVDTVIFSISGPYTTMPNLYYWYPMGLGYPFLLSGYPTSNTADRYWATFAQFGPGVNDSIYVDTVYIYGYNDGNTARNMYLYLWSHNATSNTPSGAPFYTSAAISVPAGASQFYPVRPNRKIPSTFWYGQNSRVGTTGTGLKPPFWSSPFIGQNYTLVSTSMSTWSGSSLLGYVAAPLYMYFKIMHTHPTLSYFTPDGWDSPIVLSNSNSTTLPSILKGDTTVYIAGWVALNRSNVNATVPSGKSTRNIMFLDNYSLAQTTITGPYTISPWNYIYASGYQTNISAGRHSLAYKIDWDNIVPSNVFNHHLRWWGEQYVFAPIGYLNYNTPTWSSYAPLMYTVGSGYTPNVRAFRIKTVPNQWTLVAIKNSKYGSSSDSIDLDLKIFDDAPTSPKDGLEHPVAASTLGPDKIDFITIWSTSEQDLYPGVYSFGAARDSFQIVTSKSAIGYVVANGTGTFDVTLPDGQFAYVENVIFPQNTNPTLTVSVPDGNADIALYLYSKKALTTNYGNPFQYVTMADANGVGGSESVTYSSTSGDDTTALVVIVKSTTGKSPVTIRFNNVVVLPVDENADNFLNTITYTIPTVAKPGNSIVVTSPTLLPFSVKLYDVTGREVATLFDGLVKKGKTSISIPSNLKAGIYYVEVRSGGNREMHKMIVMR